MRHASILLAIGAALFFIVSIGMAGEAGQTAPAPAGIAVDEGGAGHTAGTIESDKDEKGGKMTSERYRRGWEMLRTIDGEVGEAVVESLQDIAPDFAEYLIEYPFGDIYSRPGLDLKSREIAVVAALTAMGTARPQLKVHISAALNVGCTREEIVETIMMMSVYAGFPAALNGLAVAKEVFAEHE